MIMTTVTTNGRIVIPSKVRQRLNLKPGTRIYVTERESQILLQPLTRGYFTKIAGILKTKGRLTKAILKERIRQKKFEEENE